MLRKLGLALVCLWPGLAAAQGLPSIEATPEGLQPLNTMDANRPFTAVGRLETGSGFCTATLIAPDLLLTAAHCLYDTDGTRRPDEAFTFNAAFQNGRVAAQRGLLASYVHPSYQYDHPDNQERIRTDIAVLRLDNPISSGSVRPLRFGGDVGRDGLVDVVSYGQTRENFPSLEEDCEAIGNGGGVMILTCDTVFGSSGAPVMVETAQGRHSIVSVVSAGSDYQGAEVTLAAAVDGSIEQLLQMAGARNPGRTVAELPQLRVIGQDDGRETSGARFIRP